MLRRVVVLHGKGVSLRKGQHFSSFQAEVIRITRQGIPKLKEGKLPFRHLTRVHEITHIHSKVMENGCIVFSPGM